MALTGKDLPTPAGPSAFQDNHGEIWLFELDPPSLIGKWRIPGGTITKVGSNVLDIALERRNVTRLARMAPLRLRNSK